MHSLQARLSSGLLLSLIAVFFGIWWFVSYAVHGIAEDYMISRMTHDSDSILTAITYNTNGKVSLENSRIDGIYQRPFSGHYFQVHTAGETLRSRSLWDQELYLPEVMAGGMTRLHLIGPQKQPLLVIVNSYNKQGNSVRIAVAEDLTAIEKGIVKIKNRFSIITGTLLLLMVGIQLVIVRAGLKPLTAVREEVHALLHGELRHLSQVVPREVAPLVSEINRLIDVLQNRLSRSRNAIGDLAHALKKPLTLLQQLSNQPPNEWQIDNQQTLVEQTTSMKQMIDRELRRARLAGAGPVGTFFDLDAELPLLLKTLHSMHRQKEVVIDSAYPPQLTLPFDREDMLELLGNLLDNAFKWARHKIRLHVSVDEQLTIVVEDDGPGVDDDAIEHLTQRGKRLDESVHGHGLGLAIVDDIVAQYHGKLSFRRSQQLQGLSVQVTLPLP
jgi:signal transduction histidine kinase